MCFHTNKLIKISYTRKHISHTLINKHNNVHKFLNYVYFEVDNHLEENCSKIKETNLIVIIKMI